MQFAYTIFSPLKYFFTLVEKSYRQIASSFSLSVSLIKRYYVTQVGRRGAGGLLCLFAANHHEAGQVDRGSVGECQGEKKQKGAKRGDSRAVTPVRNVFINKGKPSQGLQSCM